MIRIILTMAAGIVSISFAAIFIRFCDDVPAIMIATYRLTLASLILLIYALSRRGFSFRAITRSQWLLGLLGGFFLALHFSTWITSLKYTSVTSSVVLVTTNPLWVGLFSYLIFKEKQSIALVAGIFLSIAGSVILALGDSGLTGLAVTNPNALLGDLLALSGAVMASAYLMVGSRMRKTTDVLTYVVIVYSFSALFLLIFSVAAGLSFTGYKDSSYLYMLLLAVVPQLIGHTAINWSLEHLKASMVAISILGEPIGSSFLAFLFFGETIGTIQMGGIVLIFTAIILASRKGLRT